MQTGIAQAYYPPYQMGSAEIHIPMADHMGNIRHYFQIKSVAGSVTGQISGNLEYDAFGREVRAWGTTTGPNPPPGLPANRPFIDQLPFHFSSKFTDQESGFNYYGYRFYNADWGRWLNRDPIEEAGGHNLYGMVKNNAVNWIDLLGLRLPDEDLRELDKIALGQFDRNGNRRPTPAPILKSTCERFVDSLVSAAEGGRKCNDCNLVLASHFGVIVKRMGSYARGPDGARGLPVDGFQDNLVNNRQGGQVYQHILGHAAGVLGGNARDPMIGEIARRYAQKQQERDQRQRDNPNDPRDPHDPAEAETELRDDKAGEAVGRALSDFCRNQSLTGEDLKRKLMKTLCDQ